MEFDFDKDARYKYGGLKINGKDIRAEFTKTFSGLFRSSSSQTVSETEERCFAMARDFEDLSPRLSVHSDAADALQWGRSRIQLKKIELGVPLDTPKSHYS